MPRLENIEEKLFNGFKVDKENHEVIYSDEPHIYLGKREGDKYTSVTTLIKNYENPFDVFF